MNADTESELDTLRLLQTSIEVSHGSKNPQTSSYCSLGVIFMRHRIAKVEQETIAEQYRSRNAGYPAPPAQIRTCGFPSSGSYLGCVTAKRASGQGWRMRGCGSHRLARRTMRSQVIRCRWLRRRSTRSHSHLTCSRKASKRRPFNGTAWYA